MSDFRISAAVGLLLAAGLFAATCGAQAGGGAGSAQPAESEPAASTEPPPAKPQAVHCMWTNKGVTGFCAVGAEAKVGAACACSTIIEHKSRKFPGKVVVVR